MKAIHLAVLGGMVLLWGCGPTAEEQRAMDQQRCAGFGFSPGTDNFAHCMMSVTQQREAQGAADQRAAADRAAADRRAQAADQAAKDRADQDAWDKRTGQGKYSSSSSDAVAGSAADRASPFSAAQNAGRDAPSLGDRARIGDEQVERLRAVRSETLRRLVGHGE